MTLAPKEIRAVGSLHVVVVVSSPDEDLPVVLTMSTTGPGDALTVIEPTDGQPGSIVVTGEPSGFNPVPLLRNAARMLEGR